MPWTPSYPVAAILARLDRRIEALEVGRGVSTEVWFEELPVPEAQVTLLLALLELVRLRRIWLGQRMESKDGVWDSPAVAIRLNGDRKEPGSHAAIAPGWMWRV